MLHIHLAYNRSGAWGGKNKW